MPSIKPSEPESQAETMEERLRQENQDLKRQLQELKGLGHGSPHTRIPSQLWHPSSLTIWSIALAAAVLIVVAFFAGYLPLQKRQNLINGEAAEEQKTLPRVEVIRVGRSSQRSELELPGNTQAITEAPILARANGYIQRRL